MAHSTKKFYITTAIDYVNDKPHIGHALEKIQADVIARYQRLKGGQVYFLTGTDEHGAKIMRAAEAQGKSPKSLADENAERFRVLKRALDLSWDDFIRTTDKERHWPGAVSLWEELAGSGDLYKKTYRGLYCVGHEAFITEKDLANGKCRDHQTAPEVVEEENWFFRLAKYGRVIAENIQKGELKIFPSQRAVEILSLIERGLEDVSFSRPRKDLSWGIPVPGDPTQTMYVWCDALTNYVSAIGYGRDQIEFQKWWPADLHVIGKDILRFHAAIWPAMLLSSGLPLPRAILVHGFVTVDGKKMSKTIGNVVDPIALIQKYGTDPVRYYLLREIPAGEDGDFSEAKLIARYNGELADGLGNLVSRVAALGARVSPVRFDFHTDLLSDVRFAVDAAFRNYEQAFATFRLNEAIAEVWRLIAFTDRYLNTAQPWTVADATEFRKIITNAAYLISTIANLLKPFLPVTAGKVWEQIRLADGVVLIKKGQGLFPRLG